MRIAIPTEGKDLGAAVCVSFGRAPGFMVIDTDTQKSELVENTACEERGGAGIKAAQSLCDLKLDALIAPRCGENAAKVLLAAGVKLYQSVAGTLGENLEAFEKGRLAQLDTIHEGFHGHGG